MTRHAFVVGRRRARLTMVVVLRMTGPVPIIGPWTLTAVVSSN